MADFINGDQVGIRDTISSIPGADGVERYKSFYRDRLIEIRGWIKGTTESDLEAKINALQAAFDIRNLERSFTDGFANLDFYQDGQGTYRYICKPIRGAMVIAERRTGLARPFSVFLEAKDPNKYKLTSGGTDQYTFDITPGDDSGSSGFPLAFPAGFAGNSYAGSTTIDNTGLTSVFPDLVTVYGPCTGPRVSNTTTGLYVEFTSELDVLAGERLEIDFQRSTAYLYGVSGDATNVIDKLVATSDFWQLQPDDNNITFSAATMQSTALCRIVTKFT